MTESSYNIAIHWSHETYVVEHNQSKELFVRKGRTKCNEYEQGLLAYEYYCFRNEPITGGLPYFC